MELVTVELHPGYTHLSLAGRLDTAGVERLEPRFTGAVVPRRVHAIIEVSGVVFISSLGIGTLVRVARSLSVHKAKLVLVAPPVLVRGAIERAEVTTLVPIANSLEEARGILGIA